MKWEQAILVGFVSVSALCEEKLYHVLVLILAGLVES